MEYKSNHFVAKYYQKKWYNNSISSASDSKEEIKILVKKTGKIICDIPKNIAQKNNLYTFPKEFKTNESKINEKLLIKRFEDWYIEAMKQSFDKNKIPNSLEAYKLAGFVIIQSFRTLKFKKGSETIISKNINFKTSPQWHQNYSLHLSFLIIKGFPELIKNATIIFHKAPSDMRFITSDNPASYWLKKNDGYDEVRLVADNYEISDNPNLRIICPLNPKWCTEILLFQKPPKQNILQRLISFFLKSESKLKIKRKTDTLTLNEFEKIQSMIYRSADKIIIGYNETDLNTAHNISTTNSGAGH